MSYLRPDLAAATVLKYQEIIDGVVARVKPEFSQEGIDESVLDEVRALWEAKLVATGVVGEPSNEGQQVIQQQQMQQVARPGLPVGAVSGVPAGLPLAQQQQLLAMRPPGFPAGMPAGVMPMGVPPGMMMQAPGGGAPLPMAAVMQAQAMMHAQAAAAAAAAEQQKRKLEEGAAGGAPDAKQPRIIPQADGPADEEGGSGGAEGGEGEGKEAEEDDDDDDPLTEDDEDGSGDEVDEAAVANVVLGQFEKVQHSKSKWKVVLKDCVLTLNGRDYLVHKCTGEMDF